MCLWTLQNNKEKAFRLFVYLKLCYPSGKIKWNQDDKALAALTLCNTEKTINNNFKKLSAYNWIFYDKQLDYWRIKSFEKIRKEYSWYQNSSYSFELKDLFPVYSVLGGVLYTHLYKSWIKKYLKGKSNVRIKRRADKSFAYSSKVFADISVLSVKRFYGISICKAVRLKQCAKAGGFIKVRKNHNKLPEEWVQVFKKGIKYREESPNIVFKNGNYYEQLTDQIKTEMIAKRRKKIET